MWSSAEASPGIDGFKAWWNDAWKNEFAGTIYNMTEGTVNISTDLIYTPNELTRDMIKMMKESMKGS
jgi:hypothetical protein